MTFQEAVRKVEYLAGDVYHSVKYELTVSSSGDHRQECSIYYGGRPAESGFWTKSYSSWEQVFAEFEKELIRRKEAGKEEFTATEEAPL